MSYLDSGFNENLIRTIYPAAQMYDSSNVSEIIGEGAISDPQVSKMSASKLTAGILSAVTQIGDESIFIDGEERRIIVNDGTNDRVLIGKLAGKF